MRKHTISFRNAFNGIVWALTTQPNFKVHFSLSIIVLITALFLKVSRLELIILVLTIIMGFSTEMLNTAVEVVTDLITTQWKREAKIAKDVAAGMMLMTAYGAVVVASLILLPRILRLL